MSGSSPNLAVIDRVAPPPPTALPPGGPQQQDHQPAAPPPLDDLDLEAQAARDALAAEEAARAAGTPPRPAATPAAAPAATDPPAAAGQVMVPKARFDAALVELNRWRDAAMYERGAREAAEVGAPAPAAPPATPPAPSVEEQANAAALKIEEDWNAIWSEYDNGSITGTDAGAKLVPLLAGMIQLNMNRVFADVDKHVKALLANMAPPVGAVDAIMLEQQKAKLYAQHPWALALNNDEGRFLADMAMREAQALGTPFERGPVGQMKLTERVAELASVFMPKWHPGEEPPKPPTQQAADAPPATPPAPVPAAPRAPSPAFRGPDQRHVEEALRRQNNLPPTAPGSAGTAAGRIDLSRVDTMTDEELENLPAEERQRLLALGAPPS